MKTLNLILIVLLSYSAIAIGCDEAQMIKEKNSDGSMVTLDDGSVWEVNRIDRSYIISWPLETEVIACDATLTKADNGEVVEAMRIK
jgi:hypothetical protein